MSRLLAGCGAEFEETDVKILFAVASLASALTFLFSDWARASFPYL
jgi:hypothetical protein